jgi:hypothetical protein
MAEKRKGGQQTIYTEEKADAILNRIIEGEAIKKIAKDPTLPSFMTIMRWSTGEGGAPEEFAQRYQIAMQLRGEGAADKLIQIMDDLEKGKIDHNTARVLMDGAKWIAAKLYPKLYGDRREHNHLHKVDTSVADRLRRAQERVGDSTAQGSNILANPANNGMQTIDVTPEKVE